MKIDNFSEDESMLPIDHRILNLVTLLAIGLSIISTISNYLFGLGPIIITVSTTCGLLAALIYYISKVKKYYSLAILLAIFVIIFIATPVLWIFNGGIAGTTALYIIVFSSMIVVVLRGRKRMIAVGGLACMSLAMILLEYKEPSLIVSYTSSTDKYADFCISLLSTLFFNAVLTVTILNQYIHENKRAKEYFEQVEKQKLEKEMARLDRLNLVGEMAASIGHEVRNPMTTVRGFLQLFKKNKKFSNHNEQLALMIEELDRANSIITEFLSLAKDKIIHLDKNNLNQIIKNIYPLLQADALLLGKNFSLDLQDVPDLLLDENEIRQCILNLVRNSFEAIPDGGEVILKTAVINNNVLLIVKDNGSGIPPEVYSKLGTPFITTKPQGTGLGIPVCYQIAQRHNAEINVNTSCLGTTFTLSFKTAS